MATFDQKNFKKLTSKIKEDMNLNIQTHEELIKFVEENPEGYQELTVKMQGALNESLVGGTFEELDIKEMQILQGAGDVDGETIKPTIFITAIPVPVTTILNL